MFEYFEVEAGSHVFEVKLDNSLTNLHVLLF